MEYRPSHEYATMPAETPVLIAGAGPAGLATAITLSRHGIASVVVERRNRRGAHPRATGISTRSMELLRSWGLESAATAGGVDVEWTGRATESLATVARGRSFPLGMPTRSEAAAISPTAPACIPQDHLEPVLTRELHRLGRSRLVTGAEVLDVEEVGDEAHVRVRDIARGTVRTVAARWVVAADGMRSRIRTGLGIGAPGVDGLDDRISVLFRAPLWRLVERHRHGLYMITHPEAAGALLPAGRADRWIYARSFDPRADGPDDHGPERLTRLIRRAAGDPGLEPRVQNVGAVTFGAHLAERFRAGRVLLAGDAAHRVTPRGGTGLNSALKDGFDLGWKLAWVLTGWAPEDLIDTYEAERRPAVAHNLERSIDPEGSIREPGAEIAADLGGRVRHAWTGPAGARRSTVDLLGLGLTLFAAPAAPERLRGVPARPPRAPVPGAGRAGRAGGDPGGPAGDAGGARSPRRSRAWPGCRRHAPGPPRRPAHGAAVGPGGGAARFGPGRRLAVSPEEVGPLVEAG